MHLAARRPEWSRNRDLVDDRTDQRRLLIRDDQECEEPATERQLTQALLLGDGEQSAQPPRIFLPGKVGSKNLEHPASALRNVEFKSVSQGVEVATVWAEGIPELLLPVEQPAQLGDRHRQSGAAIEGIDPVPVPQEPFPASQVTILLDRHQTAAGNDGPG